MKGLLVILLLFSFGGYGTYNEGTTNDSPNGIGKGSVGNSPGEEGGEGGSYKKATNTSKSCKANGGVWTHIGRGEWQCYRPKKPTAKKVTENYQKPSEYKLLMEKYKRDAENYKRAAENSKKAMGIYKRLYEDHKKKAKKTALFWEKIATVYENTTKVWKSNAIRCEKKYNDAQKKCTASNNASPGDFSSIFLNSIIPSETQVTRTGSVQ